MKLPRLVTTVAVPGAALFGAASYFSYRYASAHTRLPQSAEGLPSDVFDNIAGAYDGAIGQEEAVMWYGTMRGTLLKHATGDVLEVSVGTGRNFQYYNLAADSGIRSLTCTDLSQNMLIRAEDKFFDELALGQKHPNVRITFCLADAHCLVDEKAAGKAREEPKAPAVAAQEAPAPPLPARLLHVPPAPGAEDPNYSPPWWAYWRRLPSGPGTSAAGEAPSTSGAASVSGAVATGGSGVAAGSGPHAPTPDDMRDMPGLHARGLLNFFRVLVPGGSSGGPGADSGADVGPGADGQEGAAAGSADHQHGPDADACGCSGSHAYMQRCTARRTEAGAPLQRFAPGQFDTVVDTFGLCSVEDPVRVLQEMARVCKPGGRILLLEHGRSNYDWLNGKLDASADDHKRKWGCEWNRDMLALVRKAGLKVEKQSRWHFGSSYYIIARAPPAG